MEVTVRRTGKVLSGRGVDGRWVRRHVFRDDAGTEYVTVGRFAGDRDALVELGWFIGNVMANHRLI